jgi:hypothetical protein
VINTIISIIHTVDFTGFFRKSEWVFPFRNSYGGYFGLAGLDCLWGQIFHICD